MLSYWHLGIYSDIIYLKVKPNSYTTYLNIKNFREY